MSSDIQSREWINFDCPRIWTRLTPCESLTKVTTYLVVLKVEVGGHLDGKVDLEVAVVTGDVALLVVGGDETDLGLGLVGVPVREEVDNEQFNLKL